MGHTPFRIVYQSRMARVREWARTNFCMRFKFFDDDDVFVSKRDTSDYRLGCEFSILVITDRQADDSKTNQTEYQCLRRGAMLVDNNS
jgi:hypothetical protein